jgi:hypothetical protein
MFLICSIQKDKSFSKEFILSTYHKNKLKMAERVTSNKISDEMKKLFQGKITEKDKDEIKKDIKNDNVKNYSFEQLAEKGNCYNYYLVYTLLSMLAAHPSIIGLEGSLLSDSKGNIKSFLLDPNVYGIDLILFYSIEVMLIILKNIAKIVKVDWKNRINNFNNKKKSLKNNIKYFTIGHKE